MTANRRDRGGNRLALARLFIVRCGHSAHWRKAFPLALLRAMFRSCRMAGVRYHMTQLLLLLPERRAIAFTVGLWNATAAYRGPLAGQCASRNSKRRKAALASNGKGHWYDCARI